MNGGHATDNLKVLFVALFGVDIWHGMLLGFHDREIVTSTDSTIVVGGQLGKHAIVVTHAEVVVFLKVRETSKFTISVKKNPQLNKMTGAVALCL